MKWGKRFLVERMVVVSRKIYEGHFEMLVATGGPSIMHAK